MRVMSSSDATAILFAVGVANVLRQTLFAQAYVIVVAIVDSKMSKLNYGRNSSNEIKYYHEILVLYELYVITDIYLNAAKCP